MNKMKMSATLIGGLIFGIWVGGSVLLGCFDIIERKHNCIQSKGLIKGFLYCEGDLDHPTHTFIKNLDWPFRLISSKANSTEMASDCNSLEALATNIPAEFSELKSIVNSYAGWTCSMEENYEKARRLLEFSNSSNNPLALGTLGELYWRGRGVAKDPTKAANYFKKSINSNRVKCSYEDMLKGAPNKEIADSLIGLCSLWNQLMPRIQANNELILAIMYVRGEGVLQNFKEAERLATLAASHGSAEALSFLGELALMRNDSIKAYMWAILGSEQANKDGNLKAKELAKELQEKTLKQLSYSDVVKAQTMAKDCLNKNYKNCQF